MKKQLSLFILSVAVVAGAFTQASISITAPAVTSWSQTVSGVQYNANAAELAALNTTLKSQFGQIQDTLNKEFFNKMKNFPDLNKGFANANAAAFDNVSLLGYQNYDLFALAVGVNLGLATPSADPTMVMSALNDVIDNGDIYAGLATGGFAVQAGLNLGFVVPNLYGTAKFGFIPEIAGDVTISQGMFGLGANYRLVEGFDLVLGLLKWRGVSVGSGLVFNGNKAVTSVPVPSQSQNFNATISGKTVALKASAEDIKAKLTVESTSVVVPIDVMTSVQALWFLNLGLGLGADLAFSSSSVKLDGSSLLKLGGATNAKFVDGSMVVTGSEAKGGGDFLLPRIAASVGMNFTVFKLDISPSYYPLSKSYAVGVTAAAVW